jgi:hypothetical protein
VDHISPQGRGGGVIEQIPNLQQAASVLVVIQASASAQDQRWRHRADGRADEGASDYGRDTPLREGEHQRQ